MRPRFLADADFNHRIVRGIRRREPTIDFSSAHEGGIISLNDPEVLGVAATLGRVLVSHDRNTMPGHFAEFILSQTSPGLIIVGQEMDI